MRKFAVVVVLVVLSSLVQADPQTDVLEKILQVNEGIKTFQAEFVQTNYTKVTEVTQEFEGKLSLKRPDKFRMEVLSPDTQLFVSDGETMWAYLSSANQAIWEDLKETEAVPQPSQILFEFSEKYNIDFGGKDTVKQRTYYLLHLKPKEENPYFARAEVWINPKSLLMQRLKVVYVQENETTLEFKKLKTNITLPESKFTFTPPEGVEVVEGISGVQGR